MIRFWFHALQMKMKENDGKANFHNSIFKKLN